MRRIVRQPLSRTTEKRLAGYQRRVDSGESVQTVWKRARGTRTLRNEVAGTLRRMAGRRERCFFCEDSRGTDVEHFWPKQPYPERAFQWLNLLFACAGCNRRKGDRFPLDEAGLPLLIDPTSDDPWDHLFLDTDTGFLVARWHEATGKPDRRGEITTDDSLLRLNTEAVTEGRLRTIRRLRRAVRGFLHEMAQNGAAGDAREHFLAAVVDNDDYGISCWFFHRDGGTESPFAELRARFPEVWETAQALVSR